jgi:hypothetical protein
LCTITQKNACGSWGISALIQIGDGEIVLDR